MDTKIPAVHQFNDKYIPIFAGITGHRDIDDERALIDRIKKIFMHICDAYLYSPVVLLTPLAEGADRAAARAVLELQKSGLSRVSYMVILPMEEGEYTGTFSGENSAAEYDDFKNQSAGCFNAPILPSLEIDKIQNTEERHSKLYANLGAYIALNTQILIAAWNGAEEAENHCSAQGTESCISDGASCPYLNIKQGGTYHVLRMRFFGLEDEYKGHESFLSNREFGPVYWIKTKRVSSPYLSAGEAVAGPAYPDYPIDYSRVYFDNLNNDTNIKCRKLVRDFFEGQGNGQNTYNEILTRLDEYNKDIYELYPLLKAEIKLSREYFTTYSYMEGSAQKKESFSFTDKENSFIHRYASADTLSFYFQKKRKKDVVLLIVLAFIGLLSFNLYSGPFGSNWFILSYSLIYLLGGMYYICVIKTSRHHEKYVDYRGIAEGIRVQFFWHLVGIEAKVTDKYLTKQKSSIEWVRIAISNAFILCSPNREDGMDVLKYKENISAAHKLWLLNQYTYYRRKSPQKDRTDLLQKRLEKALFMAGLTLAIILAVLDTYEFITNGTSGMYRMFIPLVSDSGYQEIHKWLVFAVGFMPVIIASFTVFTELLAYSKLSRNFKWMAMVYNIALHDFKRFQNSHGADAEVFIQKARKLFYDVGVEALLENGEWIGIFEERAPEMPK